MNEECRRTAAYVLTKLFKDLYIEGVANDMIMTKIADCAGEFNLIFDFVNFEFCTQETYCNRKTRKESLK